MRVISGSARGRTLRAARQTRPTADLVKGAIFSMLEALAYKRGLEPDGDGNFAAAQAWPRVLDLFAGSGGLGIEALSRGAAHAEFVESDRDAARIVESNLRMTDLADRARVQHAPVELALSRTTGQFDLVFADPPYDARDALATAVELLGSKEVLTPQSVVVLEQRATDTVPHAVGPLPLASTRQHGGTRISLYAL